MRSVAQFYQDCLNVATLQDPIDLLLADASGCVLAEDVVAPFNLPGMDVAAYDGYAARAEDLGDATSGTPAKLMVTAEVAAGDGEREGLVPLGAARIASGARLPIGADCVVPLALTDLGTADVLVKDQVIAGTGVRFSTEDMAAGQVVLRSGTRLGAQHIAALAAIGRLRAIVHPRPRVIILSVGDELADLGSTFRPGVVFDTNGPALAAAAAAVGAEAFRVGAVPDQAQTLRDVVEDQLMRADLVITTGGLSFGSGGVVREVMQSLGDVRFDEVGAWPGSMLGVGTIGAEQGRETPVFCLPGNPVAAQVAFEVYVRPALRRMQGWQKVNRDAVRATITSGWRSVPGRREFIGVRLVGSPRDGYTASVSGSVHKQQISALAAANALAIVPEDVVSVNQGDTLACLLLE